MCAILKIPNLFDVFLFVVCCFMLFLFVLCSCVCGLKKQVCYLMLFCFFCVCFDVFVCVCAILEIPSLL